MLCGKDNAGAGNCNGQRHPRSGRAVLSEAGEDVRAGVGLGWKGWPVMAGPFFRYRRKTAPDSRLPSWKDPIIISDDMIHHGRVSSYKEIGVHPMAGGSATAYDLIWQT